MIANADIVALLIFTQPMTTERCNPPFPKLVKKESAHFNYSMRLALLIKPLDICFVRFVLQWIIRKRKAIKKMTTMMIL